MRRVEAVLGPAREQLGRLPGARLHGREGELVFGHAGGGGGLGRPRHGQRHRPALAEGLDLGRVLDRAHGREERREVGEGGRRQSGGDGLGDEARHARALHADRARPLLCQHRFEEGRPLAVHPIDPGADITDMGHAPRHGQLDGGADQHRPARARHHEQHGPVVLDAEVAPEVGEVANRIGLGDDGEVDAVPGHPFAKLPEPPRARILHPLASPATPCAPS